MKLFAATVVIFLVTGCSGASARETAGDPQAPMAQIANPASTHCLEKGGKLEMMREEAGIFGVCVFDDGSRCEEWRFLRGECSPGSCTRDDGRC